MIYVLQCYMRKKAGLFPLSFRKQTCLWGCILFYMPVIRFHRSPKSSASSSRPVAFASRSPRLFT